MTGLWACAYAAQWIVLMVMALVMIGVLHHLGMLYHQVNELVPIDSNLQLGENVSDISVRALAPEEGEVSLGSLLHGSTFLLIVTPSCSGCHHLLSRLPQIARALPTPGWEFLILSESGDAAARGMTGDVAVAGLPLRMAVDAEARFARKYHIRATPFAIAVDSVGTAVAQTAVPTEEWFMAVASARADRTSISVPVASPRPAGRIAVGVLTGENGKSPEGGDVMCATK